MKYLSRNGIALEETDPLTAKVIGLAFETHKELGPGFMECPPHNPSPRGKAPAQSPVGRMG
jgi:hypothetical protein